MITNETKENSHLAVTGFVLKNDIEKETIVKFALTCK